MKARVHVYRDGKADTWADEPTFEFGGLHPGSYALVAQTDDGRVGILSGLLVQPRAERELALEVQRGCDVLLRLKAGGTGRGYEALANGTLIEEGWLDPGEETGVFLPPGPITVRWWSGEEDARVLEHEDERVIASPDERVVIEYEAPR